MISEAEKASREFFTAVALSEAEQQVVGFERMEAFATQFLEMEPTNFEDGLIFVMVGRALVGGELNARHLRTQAQDADDYETIVQALDWLTAAALEILWKGLTKLGSDSGTPIEPRDYVPNELNKPMLN
ncbi:MAG: hypothetical protein AAGF25_02240 [Pseudomonadota bacterium]